MSYAFISILLHECTVNSTLILFIASQFVRRINVGNTPTFAVYQRIPLFIPSGARKVHFPTGKKGKKMFLGAADGHNKFVI